MRLVFSGLLLITAAFAGCSQSNEEGTPPEGENDVPEDTMGDGGGPIAGTGDGDGDSGPSHVHPTDGRPECEVSIGDPFDWDAFCQSLDPLASELASGCSYTRLTTGSFETGTTVIVLDNEDKLLLHDFVNASVVPHTEEDVPDCLSGEIPVCATWYGQGTAGGELGPVADLCTQKTGMSFGGAQPQ